MAGRFLQRAFQVWKTHVLELAVSGLISWGTLIVALAIISFLRPPAWLSLPLMVAALSIMQGITIAANYAVRIGKADLPRVLRVTLSKTLDAATALLFSCFPAITGALVGMVLVYMGGTLGAFVGVALAVMGVLGWILVSLMPYQAVEHGWQGAMARSVGIGRKVYITLLLLHAFFLLIYITPFFYLPPTTAVAALMVMDIFLLAHIRHQAFFEVLDSVSVHE